MAPAGESDHDLLNEVRGDVKHILKALDGSDGNEGLCAKVDRHETTLTRHGTYFALVAGAFVIGVPVLLWLADRL